MEFPPLIDFFLIISGVSNRSHIKLARIVHPTDVHMIKQENSSATHPKSPAALPHDDNGEIWGEIFEDPWKILKVWKIFPNLMAFLIFSSIFRWMMDWWSHDLCIQKAAWSQTRSSKTHESRLYHPQWGWNCRAQYNIPSGPLGIKPIKHGNWKVPRKFGFEWENQLWIVPFRASSQE